MSVLGTFEKNHLLIFCFLLALKKLNNYVQKLYLYLRQNLRKMLPWALFVIIPYISLHTNPCFMQFYLSKKFLDRIEPKIILLAEFCQRPYTRITSNAKIFHQNVHAFCLLNKGFICFRDSMINKFITFIALLIVGYFVTVIQQYLVEGTIHVATYSY